MDQNSIPEQTDRDAALLDLGVVLGQTHAFGVVAGRCSAAQAEGLRHLRDERLYKCCAVRWDEFCPKFLKISRTEADRTIQLLEEFGPAYFDLSQLTRISPETYRAIAPAVKDGALHVNGEAIPLVPENSRKVSAAVAELRRSLEQLGSSMRIGHRITDLNKRCCEIVAEFAELARNPELAENRLLFTTALTSVCQELCRIADANGVKY